MSPLPSVDDLRLPLEVENACDRDNCISFLVSDHKYAICRSDCTPTNEVIGLTVTQFAGSCFTPFDADTIINRYFERWKANSSHKLHAVIHGALSAGGAEEDCKHAIKEHWNRSAVLGTQTHKQAELVCNSIAPEVETNETRALRQWLVAFQPEAGWKPYRTEWKLWYEEPRLNGSVLLAGTLDLLLKSEATGKYALVDFKRADPCPKYPGGPLSLIGPSTQQRYHPGWARTPLEGVEDSKYGSYCMQLNILRKILKERYAIDVHDQMYLLQLHEDMTEAHCVQVPRFDQQTNCLFAVQIEARLLSQ